MPADPFFSIVLPTYNRCTFIPAAIVSVLHQQFDSWELIVVDDGSTDDTRNVVNQFTDQRINYCYQQNAERSAARNNGIRQSKGKYICFLDDDDVYLPDHLQVLHQFISEHDFPRALLFTDTLWNGKVSDTTVDEVQLKKNAAEFFLKTPIGNPRVCINYAILQEFKFDETISMGEDILLWIPVSLKYPVYHVVATTVNCSIHALRSVNLTNPVFPPIISNFKKLFSRYNDSGIISEAVKNEILSSCYHRKANFHYLHKSFFPMLGSLLLSFYFQPDSRQNKTKLYLIKSYLFGPVIDNFE